MLAVGFPALQQLDWIHFSLNEQNPLYLCLFRTPRVGNWEKKIQWKNYKRQAKSQLSNIKPKDNFWVSLWKQRKRCSLLRVGVFTWITRLQTKTTLLRTVTTGYYCYWTPLQTPVCCLRRTHSGVTGFVWKKRIENNLRVSFHTATETILFGINWIKQNC